MVGVKEEETKEDNEGSHHANDDGLRGCAEEGDGTVGDQGAHDSGHHLANMDGVATKEHVVEEQAHGASAKGGDHGEDSSLGGLEPPCALHPQGAGTVHGQVAPPCDEEAGTAEGGVPHDHSLGVAGDASPGSQVDGGHQTGPAPHQVDNSTTRIVHCS